MGEDKPNQIYIKAFLFVKPLALLALPALSRFYPENEISKKLEKETLSAN
jgi:hypothetical protein